MAKSACTSRIAHESRMVVTCGVDHVLPNPDLHGRSVDGQSVWWKNDDDRVIHDGEQLPPVGNDLPHIADLVVEDIRARKRLGIERYGQPLQPHNGRDALRDLYEELLDGAHYVRQEMWQRDHPEVTGDRPRRWPRLDSPGSDVRVVRHVDSPGTVWRRADPEGHFWTSQGYPQGVSWTQVLRWGEVEEVRNDG